MQWTLAQVKEHPLWRGITDKERRFFELLEETQLDDAAAAVRAFDLQPQSVQVRLNQVRGAMDTGFLYRAMMGFAVPTIEEVIAQFWLMADKTKDEARRYMCLSKIAELMPSPKAQRKDAEAKTAAAGPLHGASGPATPPTPLTPIPDLSDFKE
jgi:hypothetical protein